MFTSCNMFKKTTRSKKLESLEVIFKKDSSESIKIKTDSIKSILKVDKGIIITETETTIINEKKGAKTSKTVDLKNIKDGKELLLKDSAGFKISLLLDTLKNQLSIQVEQPEEKTTTNSKTKVTENKNTTKKEEHKTSNEYQKQVAVTNDNKQKSVQKEDDKVSEPKGWSFLYFWIGGVIALCLIILFIRYLIKKGKEKILKI